MCLSTVPLMARAGRQGWPLFRLPCKPMRPEMCCHPISQRQKNNLPDRLAWMTSSRSNLEDHEFRRSDLGVDNPVPWRDAGEAQRLGWVGGLDLFDCRAAPLKDSGQNGAFDDPNKGSRWAEEDHPRAGSGYCTEAQPCSIRSPSRPSRSPRSTARRADGIAEVRHPAGRVSTS
jgi:hypothetical protein